MSIKEELESRLPASLVDVPGHDEGRRSLHEVLRYQDFARALRKRGHSHFIENGGGLAEKGTNTTS
jgi:hypothetical protein